jgi:type VI secretion system VasD/TssJ family lipoprotein
LKRFFPITMLFFVLVFMSSCATPPPPVPVYSFAKDAIKLRVKSDRQLNINENSPHTLVLCVYQVRDKSMFDQLSSNEDGIFQLLDCEPFHDSVTATKRLIIQPNQDLTFVMDRMEKTKNLGIAAGYFKLEKNRITRIFDIPVSIVSKSEARVDPLNLSINLGAQQIVGAEAQ